METIYAMVAFRLQGEKEIKGPLRVPCQHEWQFLEAQLDAVEVWAGEKDEARGSVQVAASRC